MRTLKFIVNGQILEKDLSCDFNNIIPGTKGYLRAVFSFSSEWNKCVKAAEFSAGPLRGIPVRIDDNNSCDIPYEICNRKSFKIKIVGRGLNGYQITTNTIFIN